MCLLIAHERGSQVKESELKNGYENNSDGAGYSFAINGQIQIRKYRHFKKFLKGYKRDIKAYGETSSFLVHFRIGTHGTNKGTTNVHPFKVNSDLVFAHNGMISAVRNDDKYSDPQVVNTDVLQLLPDNFLSNEAIQELIAEYIGSSKLAFLNKDGDTTIINEDLGHWDGGIWFSNKSYQDSYGKYNYSFGAYGNTVTSAQYLGTGGVIWRNDKAPTTVPPKSTKKKLSGGRYVCEWCGDETDVVHTVDVSSQFYGGCDSPVQNVDMCPQCLDYENKWKQTKGESVIDASEAF